MPGYFIGLMSGTSLDGVDGVLAAARGARFAILAAVHRSFPSTLRDRLLALQAAGPDEIHRAALAANDLCADYARTVRALLARARARQQEVVAIGCHGQTVRHDPASGYTTQLMNGARLAELTGIATVCDFRSRDIAAGGEGAPLAPALHDALFRHPHRNRAVLNIGGMANITNLPARGRTTGFDCGPGNALMDAWISEQRANAYDRNGAWAARGKVVPALLHRLESHPFLRRRPPKSTGRHEFNLDWVKKRLSRGLEPADVQATLLEFTAVTIVRALGACRPAPAEIYVCGGGARNGALMTRLTALLPGRKLASTDRLGVPAEHVEALAFAWLAREALARRPGNLPQVTGARGPRVLGAIYPA